ncbi:cytoplasmic protein [Tianweitania sp. BSSL-BM11]|uniref:Cytoplasmic protein n=1 Tax=Tianweitania aestuarii TaxID=2814886 RepID=A0ABS5RS35_9HYPH|nr:cytoplasmic protein [Tianweitania aestuarii]MBS9719865.1 cytoplasmic protein [Tianweitania aestuarii]
MTIKQEKAAFLRAKAQYSDHARQTAAVFILSGIDLAAALRSTGPERLKIAARLRRMIERERLRGINRHWSYDLNRHIAMKQALDRLVRLEGSEPLAA